jgi:uncharacterized membrane protein YfcA
LIAVFFNALSGSIVYARAKTIDYKTGVTFALAAIPGSKFGDVTTASINRQKFDLLFGALLSIFSVLLLLRPGRKSGGGETQRSRIPLMVFETLARLGARLSRRIHADWMLLGLDLALGWVGLRVVIVAWP